MCGRINLIDNDAIRAVFEQYGVHFSDYADHEARPTDNLQCITLGKDGHYHAFDASWWLLRNSDFSANTKLVSFNSKANKLLQRSSAHYQSPRSFPVLVPCSGFYEWHQNQPYWIQWQEDAVLAGVAKAWQQASGDWRFSCSIITLAPHHQFSQIHDKSVPLILPASMQATWLRHEPWQQKSVLSESKLYVDLQAVAVEKDLKRIVPAPPIRFTKDV